MQKEPDDIRIAFKSDAEGLGFRVYGRELKVDLSNARRGKNGG